jgi:hypothetical protein
VKQYHDLEKESQQPSQTMTACGMTFTRYYHGWTGPHTLRLYAGLDDGRQTWQAEHRLRFGVPLRARSRRSPDEALRALGQGLEDLRKDINQQLSLAQELLDATTQSRNRPLPWELTHHTNGTSVALCGVLVVQELTTGSRTEWSAEYRNALADTSHCAPTWESSAARAVRLLGPYVAAEVIDMQARLSWVQAALKDIQEKHERRQ